MAQSNDKRREIMTKQDQRNAVGAKVGIGICESVFQCLSSMVKNHFKESS